MICELPINLEIVVPTCLVTVVVYSTSMTKNIIIAVRGQGSHYEKLRHILDSFSHDIEFIFLSRDSRTWLADLIGRTPSAVLLLVPNSLLLSYSLDARKYWPDSVLYCEKPFFNSSTTSLLLLTLLVRVVACSDLTCAHHQFQK